VDALERRYLEKRAELRERMKQVKREMEGEGRVETAGKDLAVEKEAVQKKAAGQEAAQHKAHAEAQAEARKEQEARKVEEEARKEARKEEARKEARKGAEKLEQAYRQTVLHAKPKTRKQLAEEAKEAKVALAGKMRGAHGEWEVRRCIMKGDEFGTRTW
jgi:hypothetical protein